jgi:hypothetical protein
MAGGNYPHREEPLYAIDNDFVTKWLDLKFAAQHTSVHTCPSMIPEECAAIVAITSACVSQLLELTPVHDFEEVAGYRLYTAKVGLPESLLQLACQPRLSAATGSNKKHWLFSWCRTHLNEIRPRGHLKSLTMI